MNILNLVIPNEYEILMTKLECENKVFKEASLKIVQAIVDIICVYGHIQRTIRTPNRPLIFNEFMILQTKNSTFILPAPQKLIEIYGTKKNIQKLVNENLVFTVSLSVRKSWNFESHTLNAQLFLADFAKRETEMWHIKYYFDNVFNYLIPPNFEELLNQILTSRKVEEEAAKNKKEEEAR